MNRINIALILLIACTHFNYCYTQQNLSENHCSNSYSLMVQKSAFYIKKHAMFIALLPLIISNHSEIVQYIINQPYMSSLGFYCLLHYVCDSLLQYQEQKALIDLITLIKEISLYLVISYGIKNHMHQKNIYLESLFDDQIFLNNITNNLEYSFQEITTITLTSYQELKSMLQSLNSYIEIESEEFVFLCNASSIKIDNLLYLTQKDSVLYQKIYAFEKDPKNNAQLLEYLKSKITTAFMKLEKNLLQNDIHSCLV